MKNSHLASTPDSTSFETLAERGLDPRVVPTDDVDGFAAWYAVVRRGFLDTEPSADNLDASRERLGYRRKTGVYDPTGPVPEEPVATIASWIADLSLPGGRSIPSCAISSVTVAPTHRRRGLARTMVEGELRVAAELGVPMAMLTVSESTIYGRFGFGPATTSAGLVLDVKRAAWIGPVPEGRVDFISRETIRGLFAELHERVRLSWPGEIEMPGGHWDHLVGTRPDAKDAAQHRAIQYTDADGTVRGLAIYDVRENPDDFTKSTVTIGHLLAETDDAYAALWRFFVELDLVGRLEANELSIDEPLVWMISDQRAAKITLRDHQYLRILDVPAVLEARRYDAPGRLVLDVVDPLGFAEGRWSLTVDADGAGTVEALPADATVDALDVRIGITELSAAVLGGVSLATLAAAGRVQTTDATAAARILSWHTPPRLTFWY